MNPSEPPCTRYRTRSKKTLAGSHDPTSRLQWVCPEGLHLTLKFLGDIQEGQVEEIKEALRPVLDSARVLTVSFTHLGVFPDTRAPRVLWVGCRATPSVTALVELATAIDQALVPLGFEPERRPFQPHLTMARIKEGARPFGQAVLRSRLLDLNLTPSDCLVGQVYLVQSELRSSGAVYTPLWHLPLGEP